jgi:bacteriorhodopsin
VELVILAVACVAYLFILISDPSQWLKLRYIDWFITVPLLVYAISTYNDAPFWLLASLATAMLFFGFLTVVKPTQ